jgi:hypothetical protein
MSRGLGRWQNAFLSTIRVYRRPLTFEDFLVILRQGQGVKPGVKPKRSFARSLRRALQTLVRNQLLITIGKGGPGDPFRYFLHPMLVGMTDDADLRRTLEEAYALPPKSP